MIKIYVFSANPRGGEGLCYALGEDGQGMGSHLCSNECYAPLDLGMVEGARPNRHEIYKKAYPEGYTMEFVSRRDGSFERHERLQNAIKLNRETEGQGREYGKAATTADGAVPMDVDEQRAGASHEGGPNVPGGRVQETDGGTNQSK